MEGQGLQPPPERDPRPSSADRLATGAAAQATSQAPTAPQPPRARRRSGARRAVGGEEPWRPVVPYDVAAMVIGRAAELEQDGRGGGLDEQAILEIGEEVGLAPAMVREALDEYHAGLLRPDDAVPRTVVGPRALIIERSVPGPVGHAEALVRRLLEDKLFECCRQAGSRSVWRPREGLLASITRAAKRLGRGDKTLDDVTEITVSLVDLPVAPGQAPCVRVRLEVECRSLRQGLAATTLVGGAVAGAGMAAAAGTAISLGEPLALLGVPALGAAAAGAYVVPRRVYRSKLAEVELVLQGALDDAVRRSVRRR